jgi:hypothetical protein
VPTLEFGVFDHMDDNNRSPVELFRKRLLIVDATRRPAFMAITLPKPGPNYVVGHFVFGDMTLAESLNSIELFAAEVMPLLRKQPATR